MKENYRDRNGLYILLGEYVSYDYENELKDFYIIIAKKDNMLFGKKVNKNLKARKNGKVKVITPFLVTLTHSAKGVILT